MDKIDLLPVLSLHLGSKRRKNASQAIENNESPTEKGACDADAALDPRSFCNVRAPLLV